VDWHTGNIWDPSTKAFKSVQAVRTLHSNIRTALNAKNPGKHKMNAYNMSTVQTGFMGALTLPSNTKFGLKATEEELSDYVFFWRCVGRQLGISDDFNLCGRGPKPPAWPWAVTSPIFRAGALNRSASAA
jgi:hypothetical protein